MFHTWACIRIQMIFYCYDYANEKFCISKFEETLGSDLYTMLHILAKFLFNTHSSLYHKQTENGFTNVKEFVNQLENDVKSSFSLIHSLCYATMDIDRFGTIQNPTYRIFKE